jgi:hypothetical protein
MTELEYICVNISVSIYLYRYICISTVHSTTRWSCSLYAVCCILYAVFCMLYTVCCVLYAGMLYAVCCVLYAVMRYAVCCMLYAVCGMLCAVYIYLQRLTHPHQMWKGCNTLRTVDLLTRTTLHITHYILNITYYI